MLPRRRLSHAQGYLGLGMIAEAAAELEQLPQSEAEMPAAIAVRLAVLHEQHNWPSLRDLAGRLIERGPADAGIWITWAYATRRSDSLNAAEAILIRAEQLHPDEPTIHFNLGCYASLRGDLRTAQRRVAHAIALDKAFAQLAASDPDLASLRAADAAKDLPPEA